MAFGWALLCSVAPWAYFCKTRMLMVVCAPVSWACCLCRAECVPVHAAEGS